MRVDGDRVRLERERRAWSQDHLAAAAGIGVRTIQRVEATGIASYESVRAISAALQIPVVDLRVSDGPSLPTMTDAELRASGLRELAALPRRGGAARLRLTVRCFGAAMAVAILAATSGFLLLEDYRQVRVLRTLEHWVTEAAPATATARRATGG